MLSGPLDFGTLFLVALVSLPSHSKTMLPQKCDHQDSTTHSTSGTGRGMCQREWMAAVMCLWPG
jgi:hypothetical protein